MIKDKFNTPSTQDYSVIPERINYAAVKGIGDKALRTLPVTAELVWSPRINDCVKYTLADGVQRHGRIASAGQEADSFRIKIGVGEFQEVPEKYLAFSQDVPRFEIEAALAFGVTERLRTSDIREPVQLSDTHVEFNIQGAQNLDDLKKHVESALGRNAEIVAVSSEPSGRSKVVAKVSLWAQMQDYLNSQSSEYVVELTDVEESDMGLTARFSIKTPDAAQVFVGEDGELQLDESANMATGVFNYVSATREVSMDFDKSEIIATPGEITADSRVAEIYLGVDPKPSIEHVRNVLAALEMFPPAEHWADTLPKTAASDSDYVDLTKALVSKAESDVKLKKQLDRLIIQELKRDPSALQKLDDTIYARLIYGFLPGNRKLQEIAFRSLDRKFERNYGNPSMFMKDKPKAEPPTAEPAQAPAPVVEPEQTFKRLPQNWGPKPKAEPVPQPGVPKNWAPKVTEPVIAPTPPEPKAKKPKATPKSKAKPVESQPTPKPVETPKAKPRKSPARDMLNLSQNLKNKKGSLGDVPNFEMHLPTAQGGYLRIPVSWDASETSDWSDLNLKNALITFVKAKATHRQWRNLGNIGPVKFPVIDKDSGYAEALVASENAANFPQEVVESGKSSEHDTV